MIKVAVTGSSGFIGKRFCDVYSNEVRLTEIKALVRNSIGSPLYYDLEDYNSLEKALFKIDTVVHCAFDHQYKENLNGLKNIMKACERVGVKRLIFLSSISVYDPHLKGNLDEYSHYSFLNDPYSREKISLEKILLNSNVSFEIVILQPTIVYGLGGNWTQYALNACLSKEIGLPDKGKQKCNLVYVDDVCQAIFLSLFLRMNNRIEKYLISGEEVTWQDFYIAHNKLLKKKLTKKFDFKEVKNKYHDKVLLNVIFYWWFETFLGLILNRVVGLLKAVKSKSYKKVKDKLDLEQLENQENKNVFFSPSGITRLVHDAQFSVNCGKAARELKYEPKFKLVNNNFLEG